MRTWLAAATLLVALDSIIAGAQEERANELAITLGRTFIGDQSVPNTGVTNNVVRFGRGLSLAVAYARQLKKLSSTSFTVELPVVVDTDEDLTYGANQVPLQYRSFFVSPSGRLNILPDSVVTPWVSFGGGLGHFQASKQLLVGGTNPGPRVKTTGVMQVGLGFDVHMHWKYPNLRPRVEFRDNWSGEPPITVVTGTTRCHNYYIGGGLVYGF